MQIGTQFGFTGQNSLNPLNQNLVPNLNKDKDKDVDPRYPGLNAKELKDLENAAIAAGYTGNRLQEGKDLIYQGKIKQFNNIKKLEERDGLINKQCYETSMYSGSDKKLREQSDRVTILGQEIKRAYPKLKADYDDCEIIQAYITGKGYQEQYNDYIQNGDPELLNILKGDSRGAYSGYDENFWQTDAGMYTTLGLGAGGIGATLKYGPKVVSKAVGKLAKGVKEKAGNIIGNLAGNLGGDVEGAVDLEKIGKGLYSEVVEPSEKDLRMTQSAEGDKLLLKDRQNALKQAETELSKAIEGGNEEEIKAAQQVVDDLKGKVTKLTSKVEKGTSTLSDTAMKYNLFGTTTSIGNQANYYQKKLWQDTIEPLLSKSTYKINLNGIVDDVCDKFINNIDGIAGSDPEAIERLKDAAEKIKKSYRGVDYTDLDAIKANNIKSEIAQRNVKYYDSLAKGGTIDEVKEAETLVREEILKQMRNEIYNAGDEVLKSMGEDGAQIRQLFKDYGDLEQIAQNALKGEKPTGIAGAKNWLEQNIKTRAGKYLTEKGKEVKAGEVGKAIKGAEEVAEEGSKVAKTAGKVSKVAGKGKGLLKGLIKGGKVFTILEDGSLIPGSPSNIAMEAIFGSKENSYQGEVAGYTTYWDKDKVNKAVNKAEKAGYPKGVFKDLYGGWYYLNENGNVIGPLDGGDGKPETLKQMIESGVLKSEQEGKYFTTGGQNVI